MCVHSCDELGNVRCGKMNIFVKQVQKIVFNGKFVLSI